MQSKHNAPKKIPSARKNNIHTEGVDGRFLFPRPQMEYRICWQTEAPGHTHTHTHMKYTCTHTHTAPRVNTHTHTKYTCTNTQSCTHHERAHTHTKYTCTNTHTYIHTLQ